MQRRAAILRHLHTELRPANHRRHRRSQDLYIPGIIAMQEKEQSAAKVDPRAARRLGEDLDEAAWPDLFDGAIGELYRREAVRGGAKLVAGMKDVFVRDG